MAKLYNKSVVERLAEEAEEAARRQDLKTLYRITKTLSGRLVNNDVPVRDNEYNNISSEASKIMIPF